jgi:AcrR family transcriptional regulator
MARTQAARKAETRERLILAAADLFGRQGFHAVSAEAVADAADRTTGALYSHFGGKEGLLLALLDERERSVGRAMRSANEAATSERDRIDGLWTNFVGPAGDRDDDWMLLEHELWLYAARHADGGDLLARRYASARAAMGQSFEQWATDAGEALGIDGEQLGVLVLGLLLGLEMQQRLDPSAVPDATAIAGLRRLFGRAPDTSTADGSTSDTSTPDASISDTSTPDASTSDGSIP